MDGKKSHSTRIMHGGCFHKVGDMAWAKHRANGRNLGLITAEWKSFYHPGQKTRGSTVARTKRRESCRKGLLRGSVTLWAKDSQSR